MSHRPILGPPYLTSGHPPPKLGNPGAATEVKTTTIINELLLRYLQSFRCNMHVSMQSSFFVVILSV